MGAEGWQPLLGLVLPEEEAHCLPRRNLWTSGSQNSLEGLLNTDHRRLHPTCPKFLMPWAWMGLSIYILTSSQVVLMGLV